MDYLLYYIMKEIFILHHERDIQFLLCNSTPTHAFYSLSNILNK